MKHAVITGGSGDLAQAIATVFSGLTWNVSAPPRTELDVSDSGSIESYFSKRPVDLLVCNAGMTRDRILAHQSVQDWEEVFAINYHGALRCATAVLPHMCGQQEGHIVFISSYSALHPPAGQTAYAAAKAALLGLTRDLAHTHGMKNIRVNAVLPGFLETRMTAHVSSSRRADVLAAHSLGKLSTPAETASFIRFLHENLLHTSGQIFQLDSR